MSTVVCGLDVHKETTYATILDPSGQVLVQRKMTNEDIPAFLDDPYEPPVDPEISLKGYGATPEENAYLIIKYLEDQGYLPAS